MGSKMVKFPFTPGENEHIEVTIKLPREFRSIIHGVVRDHYENLVKNAVVKLFEMENPHNPCALTPLTHTFTDECGQFLFGPLMPGKNYVIKVWYNNIRFKELTICPEDFTEPMDYMETYNDKQQK